jgi:hypothetical protein
MQLFRLFVLAPLGAALLAGPVQADIYLYKAPSGALKFSSAPVDTNYEVYSPTASTWYRNWGSSPLGAIGGQRRQAFDKIIREAAYRHPRVQIVDVEIAGLAVDGV